MATLPKALIVVWVKTLLHVPGLLQKNTTCCNITGTCNITRFTGLRQGVQKHRANVCRLEAEDGRPVSPETDT